MYFQFPSGQNQYFLFVFFPVLISDGLWAYWGKEGANERREPINRTGGL
jgi:hypothetical protein